MRPDLIDSVIGEKVPVARDVLLKELGRRRERVSAGFNGVLLFLIAAAIVHSS
jgi:hypothetical protein